MLRIEISSVRLCRSWITHLRRASADDHCLGMTIVIRERHAGNDELRRYVRLAEAARNEQEPDQYSGTLCVRLYRERPPRGKQTAVGRGIAHASVLLFLPATWRQTSTKRFKRNQV